MLHSGLPRRRNLTLNPGASVSVRSRAAGAGLAWAVCLFLSLLAGGAGSAGPTARAAEPVQLASTPALSPDGAQLAFSWRGDLWAVDSRGGAARRLTWRQGSDAEPAWSPDGRRLAFTGDRGSGRQVFVMPAAGGPPVPWTFHSEGCSLQEWFPEGDAVLVRAVRDDYWGRGAGRLFRVTEERRREERLFDDYGDNARLSPDGRYVLFTREGVEWWRKGYRGATASQIWLHDRQTGRFRELVRLEGEARSPLWRPDGRAFYYVGSQSGSFNLWERTLRLESEGGEAPSEQPQERQLTFFDDDSVVEPCLARNGSVIVFRHLFDLWRIETAPGSEPQKLEITYDGEATIPLQQRVVLNRATSVSFSPDGLEVAFIAGGDVWVMDTELREPRQVTDTPEEERDVTFSPDGKSLYFVSDASDHGPQRDGVAAADQTDIWKAIRGDEGRYWWQNDSFPKTRITRDGDAESRLSFDPSGKRLAYVRNGDLWICQPDGSEPRRIVESFSPPNYQWSPDGRWIAYAAFDDDFNSDIWIVPLDGSRPAENVSRHPDNDDNPVWSPDGKLLAYVGRHVETEVEICLVHLQKSEQEATSRDRRLTRAVDKIAKARKEEVKPVVAADGSRGVQVEIDFDGLHERVQRVSNPGVSESNLTWSPDSKRLAFAAVTRGKPAGIFTISPPDNLQPTNVSNAVGTQLRWHATGNVLTGLFDGLPGSLAGAPPHALTRYAFSARQTVDVAARHAAAFDICWRAMRDRFYDPQLNGRDWDAIREKYRPLAASAVDERQLTRVVSLMLGELNASHLGFRPLPGSRTDTTTWNETTLHLGVRFDLAYPGPGLRIRDVVPGGPADKQKSRLEPGELLLRIGGRAVEPATDLTLLLNLPPDAEVRLSVRNAAGEDREVLLRPVSYAEIRRLLYEAWIVDARRRVEELSGGKLGYLHVAAMNMDSFYRFQQELFAVGAGKEGLVIDVRENGGGFTTDHLLTALTQPRHAVTVPRGGGPGYPQDRRVYATWHKPVVVLCNQNSFSNAEIFSHAIKTLGRGQLVGTPTAGGVISTGGMTVLDIGFLRLPGRGWFHVDTGEDMELNGAVPHHVIWPQPEEMPQGVDRQLAKGVEVLLEDVARWQGRPQPKLKYAAPRRDGEVEATAAVADGDSEP